MLPRWSEEVFGKPDINLNSQDRYIYSIRLFLNKSELESPTSIDERDVYVKIDQGDSVYDIAKKLQIEQLINDANSFIYYLVYRGYDKQIQAGDYTFKTTLNSYEIAERLIDPIPGKVRFVILPGWRMEEIGASLSTSGLSFSSKELIKTLNNFPNDMKPDILSGINNLEGFFYPGSYEFERNVTVQTFVKTILSEFANNLEYSIIDNLNNQGINIYDAVILASIVEREAMIDEEKSLIASVFINRINVNMKLDSDPTVQYAIGFDVENKTWWKNPLTMKDLKIESPYNTYLNIGLPPGAICNPDLSSIIAVSEPEESNYLYFRADCSYTGKHTFSETLQEHIDKACP